MECNKDEAVRAKEIAERKFTEKDYAGAKKFALKSQSLYPELDGLTQMLMTLDVYISAQSKIGNGEVDWYRVLGVNPWADDETIRKQYRKLVLILHPDKNKAPGADGAFNLISDAWSLLSDKSRRTKYNQKLSMALSQQQVSTQIKVPSAPPSVNGYHNCNSSVASDPSIQKRSAPTVSTAGTAVSSSSFQKPNTFWTICNRCKTQYEYMRIYLNHNLLCPNCREAFFAEEKAPPSNVIRSAGHSARQKKKNSRLRTPNGNPFTTGGNSGVVQSSRVKNVSVGNSINAPDQQWNQFSKLAGTRNNISSASIAAQASVFRQAHRQVKREHEDLQVAGTQDRRYTSTMTGNSSFTVEQLHKRRRSDETCANGLGDGGAGLENVSEPGRGVQRIYGFSGYNHRPIIERDLSYFEVRKMLTAKAQSSIHKKLQEWCSNQVKVKEHQKLKCVSNNLKMFDDSAVRVKASQNQKSLSVLSSDDSNKDASAPMSINVPDPDFHNFDLDRTESSFGVEQVWAAYDEADGMPRYYARIHEVISLEPFKMKISWLNSRNTSEFGLPNWVDSGFPKTCGDFRSGKREISVTLNSFSHKVKWTKCSRGVIRILPRKGDIWALYRNWTPEWNENTPDKVVHKYDMVEVLDDYSEEQGISVSPLIKVTGFKTVFCRNTDPTAVRKISQEEMLCFSHQVPDYLLTGEEADDAPKGCRELDPAATPLELIHETEANGATMLETGVKAEEEMGKNFPNDRVDQMAENAPKSRKSETTEGDVRVKHDN